jgi:phosphoglycerate kinase
MHTLRDIPQGLLRGTGIVRIDMNDADEWRLTRALPTLQYLRSQGSSIIILAHRGRPRGYERAKSLEGEVGTISRLLGGDVHFLPFTSIGAWKKEIEGAPKGSIFLGENLRFFPGEQAGDPVFAEALASLGTYFVNEAFAVSHRADASIALIPAYLPAYGGMNLEEERNALEGIIQKAKEPFVVILGGGKAHDKLGVITHLKKKASVFLLGGVPANTILKARGTEVSASVVDEDEKDAKLITSVAKMASVMTPVDWREDAGKIMDIGEETIAAWKPLIESAGTILWNGPMGFFENPRFGKGSESLAKLIAASSAYTLVGGGETVDFVREQGYGDRFSFLSTGGGAMLALLSGERMPGLEALDRVASPIKMKENSGA